MEVRLLLRCRRRNRPLPWRFGTPFGVPQGVPPTGELELPETIDAPPSGAATHSARTIAVCARSRTAASWTTLTQVSLARLGFRLRKEHRKRRDHDNPPFLKNSVAHGEGADNP